MNDRWNFESDGGIALGDVRKEVVDFLPVSVYLSNVRMGVLTTRSSTITYNVNSATAQMLRKRIHCGPARTAGTNDQSWPTFTFIRYSGQ